MLLSELKDHLTSSDQVSFKLPSGAFVPAHFHVTEIGLLNKKFIDCGGTMRDESKISLQLWSSYDIYHRLKADKLVGIINMAETKLALKDYEIEVEYQDDTISKYSLDFDGKDFLLVKTNTDCLAKENCGLPTVTIEKVKEVVSSCCSGSDCC